MTFQISFQVLTHQSINLGVNEVSYLVFAPQQAVGLIVDTGADEVHAVVLNSKVEISKPEHQPAPRQGQRSENGQE